LNVTQYLKITDICKSITYSMYQNSRELERESKATGLSYIRRIEWRMKGEHPCAWSWLWCWKDSLTVHLEVVLPNIHMLLRSPNEVSRRILIRWDHERFVCCQSKWTIPRWNLAARNFTKNVQRLFSEKGYTMVRVYACQRNAQAGGI
jgi:hypothetical protein